MFPDATRLAILLAPLLFVPAAHAATPQAQPAALAAAHPATSADARLKQLFHDSDEAQLKRNPLEALFRGDLRYAGQFGDYISDAYFEGERLAAQSDLKALHAIDRNALSPINRVAYDVFAYQVGQKLKGLSPQILSITKLLPIDHFSGMQTFFPDISSGDGAAPFNTVKDYENDLKRIDGFIAYLSNAQDRFRQGVKAGVVQPRLVVTNMIDQFDALAAQGVEGSTFYGPVQKFPDSIPAAEQQRLRAAFAQEIGQKLIPAFRDMSQFLKAEYLPHARATVGISALPHGDKLYAYLIEQNTTLPMSADEVHQLGLSEVTRIKGEMETVKNRTGFTGTLPEFFEYIRTDPKFAPLSKEWLREQYQAIGARVDKAIPSQFSTIPKTPLEIKPVPDYLEKTQAGAYYMQGSPDGSRPGTFFYNTYDLPSRYTPGMETLYLHEAIPGHHFQISLAQENDELPNFMRFGGNTAFVEGWALYTEHLWKELGMESDPYQRFGGLNDEMLRAMRLVVDSGIHAKGWTRDQAIKYMLDNSSMSRTDATAEVERYIAIPGQALAYKVGQLTISRLKAEAQQKLGAKFDPRTFHAQVLMTGALPMPVLEKKIRDWIAAGGQ